jgi:hypothetical protein
VSRLCLSLHGALRVIKGPEMVLTIPEQAGTVDRHKSNIYTIDQVHWGKGGGE